MHGKRNGYVCIMVIYVTTKRGSRESGSSLDDRFRSDVSIHPLRVKVVAANREIYG